MAWYLTRFYKNTELSLRFAIFWSANNIGESAESSQPAFLAPRNLISPVVPSSSKYHERKGKIR